MHLVEPGGRGGVYQHTMAVAAALAGAGVDVDVHTAADHERLPLPAPIPTLACLWRFAHLRPRALRRAAVASGWLLAGIPRCHRRCRPGDVVHVQGWLSPGLPAPLVASLGLRRCLVVFSPHTTFSRAGRRWEERLLAWTARRADVVVAHSEHDRARLARWGARTLTAPLTLLTPTPDHQAVARWRARWQAGAGRRVVLVPGYLRADKGLELAVRAAARWGDGLLLAMAGEDGGGVVPARALAEELGVEVAWHVGWLPVEELVAAVAAADVVACPYPVASQSGVLAVARGLGRPSVATDVGGLAELAGVVVPPGDADALAAGVRTALSRPAPPVTPDPAVVADAYLAVYGGR